MKSGELKRFSGSLKELPALPPVALKLIEITRDNNSSFQHIARIIEADQTLTSRILKLANSPAFGLIRQIQSVERAIAMLGLDLVRSMALSIAVVDLFKPNRNHSINNVDFWRHCAACAAASERLAKRFAYSQPQEAFIAGLLHDLGKLVFS